MRMPQLGNSSGTRNARRHEPCSLLRRVSRPGMSRWALAGHHAPTAPQPTGRVSWDGNGTRHGDTRQRDRRYRGVDTAQAGARAGTPASSSSLFAPPNSGASLVITRRSVRICTRPGRNVWQTVARGRRRAANRGSANPARSNCLLMRSAVGETSHTPAHVIYDDCSEAVRGSDA
ncbi:hypothetical protein SEVIR_7G162501v4 [Setaria viridis]